MWECKRGVIKIVQQHYSVLRRLHHDRYPESAPDEVSAGWRRAGDADPGRWECGHALLPDPLAAALAPVVLAAVQPFGCSVEIVEVSAGLRQQGK